MQFPHSLALRVRSGLPQNEHGGKLTGLPIAEAIANELLSTDALN
jgi:hypothetical protein